jgi:hypothetical protein
MRALTAVFVFPHNHMSVILSASTTAVEKVRSCLAATVFLNFHLGFRAIIVLDPI